MRKPKLPVVAPVGAPPVHSAFPSLGTGLDTSVARCPWDRSVRLREQRQVVAHRRGPMLVLAGPGTGKTTTLVEAMVERLQGPDRLRPVRAFIEAS